MDVYLGLCDGWLIDVMRMIFMVEVLCVWTMEVLGVREVADCLARGSVG